MAELHITHKDLCGTVQPLVEEEAVGMQQVYLAVGGRTLSGSLANRCYCQNQAKAEEQGRTKEV